MIEPVSTVFAIGYTAGVIVAIIAGGVAGPFRKVIWVKKYVPGVKRLSV